MLIDNIKLGWNFKFEDLINNKYYSWWYLIFY